MESNFFIERTVKYESNNKYAIGFDRNDFKAIFQPTHKI